MKILLINGSPKGKMSNSLRLANAFIDGLSAETKEVTVEELDVFHVGLRLRGSAASRTICR